MSSKINKAWEATLTAEKLIISEKKCHISMKNERGGGKEIVTVQRGL